MFYARSLITLETFCLWIGLPAFLPCLSSAPRGQQNGDKFKCNKFLFALQQAVKRREGGGRIFCLRRFDLKQFVKTNIETNIETYIETYIFALSSQRRCSCSSSSSTICIFIYFSDYAASSFNLIYLPIQLGSARLGCLQLFNMHNHWLCSTNFDKYQNMMSYIWAEHEFHRANNGLGCVGSIWEGREERERDLFLTLSLYLSLHISFSLLRKLFCHQKFCIVIERKSKTSTTPCVFLLASFLDFFLVVVVAAVAPGEVHRLLAGQVAGPKQPQLRKLLKK